MLLTLEISSGPMGHLACMPTLPSDSCKKRKLLCLIELNKLHVLVILNQLHVQCTCVE